MHKVNYLGYIKSTKNHENASRALGNYAMEKRARIPAI